MAKHLREITDRTIPYPTMSRCPAMDYGKLWDVMCAWELLHMETNPDADREAARYTKDIVFW